MIIQVNIKYKKGNNAIISLNTNSFFQFESYTLFSLSYRKTRSKSLFNNMYYSNYQKPPIQFPIYFLY